MSLPLIYQQDNQKLSKLLTKGFEISMEWNEYKQNVRIRIGQMNKEIILNQTLWELPKREKMLKD